MSREFNLWYQENYVDFHNSQYKAAKAAWGARVPEGYVLVPKEPTERMIEAGIMLHSQFNSSVPHVYNAMIEAAQEEL